MTEAIKSIFPSNIKEDDPYQKLEPVRGTQSTVLPEEKLTFEDWLKYIQRLVNEDQRKK